MKDASEGVAAAYNAAREDCLVVRHEPPGLLRLVGSNSLDFLHRMSTNDLVGLSPGEVRGTVLTTAIGRTVDVVLVVRRTSDVLVMTSPGRAVHVRDWLSRYVFFNDDVAIGQEVPARILWGLYGPGSSEELGRLAALAPPSSTSFVEAGDGLFLKGDLPLPGFRVLAGPQIAAKAEALWGEEASAARQAYEALRVEQGMPAMGQEIDEQVIPLEAGLWHLVSFTKGCYIGQEVIARMESRGRVSRRLVGLRLTQVEETPQEIMLGQEAAGRLTSAILSPRFGPIGLGLVRGSVLEQERAEVQLSASGNRAVLCPLPFDDDRKASGRSTQPPEVRQV